MGWEYHERTRDRFGRFAARAGKEQLHLRLTPHQTEKIRNAARAAQMEISQYVWRTLDSFWTLTVSGENSGTSGAGPGPRPPAG